MADTIVNENEQLDWDDEISQENNFTLFEVGDYDFTVTNFERGKFEPQREGKIPAGTNMATVELTFKNPEGATTVITEKFFLLKKMEWKISEFLVSIGQKKKGEPTKPNWGTILGSSGRATLEINTYTRKDGGEGQNNRVKKYLDSEEMAPTPTQNVQPFATKTGGWK